jgi:hypothetical protein
MFFQEEIDEDEVLVDDREGWETVYALWTAHDKKCHCGNAITLEDAYYNGICNECHQRDIQFIPF